MLTKEECEKSYANLSVIRELLNINCLLTNTYDKSMATFAMLIDEHFDNQPLKFENLHDFMPVFDVTTGFWIMITSVINRNSFGGYVFDKKDVTLYFNLFTFEENRFYRYEVKE